MSERQQLALIKQLEKEGAATTTEVNPNNVGECFQINTYTNTCPSCRITCSIDHFDAKCQLYVVMGPNHESENNRKIQVNWQIL